MSKERGKRVQIGSTLSDAKSFGSLILSARSSRFSFLEFYTASLREALKKRQLFNIMENHGGQFVDLTPLFLDDYALRVKLATLYRKINENELQMQSSPYRDMLQNFTLLRPGVNLRTSLEDVSAQIAAANQASKEIPGDEVIYTPIGKSKLHGDTEPSRVLPFIKMVLRRTKEYLLYEQRSTTVPRAAEEAREVEDDNKRYDYLTMGKGRVRRTCDAEAQTTDILYKARSANTQSINTANVVSYVSNFEMFDTYQNMETTRTKLAVGDAQSVEVTTYTVGGVDQFKEMGETRSFKLALMITTRILAANVFEEQQRRFRNMILPDPLAHHTVFKYDIKELFHFAPQTAKRRAVADIAFCPGNGDIIAVAYGFYARIGETIPENGYLCIWNIKNPVNPERIFHYKMPVITLQFSPFQPQLLAIGLSDGSVEVRDITNFDDPPVAVSQRVENSSCDPINAIEWLPQRSTSSAEAADLEPFLALSQDSRVVKYRIINSPYMLAFQQIQLDRVEGSPEGLPVQRAWIQSQSNRSPQGTNMVLNPRQHDIYYVLTDEGCLHKCSTNYPHQHLEILQVHANSVNCMDFSPWSPKLFLTAGNDWCIRIWLEGILEPLVTLQNEIGPIHMAAWSKTHSTVIVSCTRKFLSIWDIRRSIKQPVSVKKLSSSFYTLFRFSRCGRSMAIGDERGGVTIMGFEDMPFPPHFQYNELELAINKAAAVKPELIIELKSVGYFGYGEPKHSRKQHCSLD